MKDILDYYIWVQKRNFYESLKLKKYKLYVYYINYIF